MFSYFMVSATSVPSWMYFSLPLNEATTTVLSQLQEEPQSGGAYIIATSNFLFSYGCKGGTLMQQFI